MLKKLFFIFSFTVSLTFAFKYTEGETLYFAKGCNGCHGVNAGGIQGYPKLARKPENYILKKLKAYNKNQIKTQNANLMVPFAQSLNKKEMRLIAYFLENIYIEDDNLYYPDGGTWGDGGS